MYKKILIIAGEASGDLHAANLVNELKSAGNSLQFFGMGGDKMRQAGVEIIQDYRQLAVVGLTEVIRHFPTLYRAFKTVQNFIEIEKPDLVILVDYPGFNLRMAKVAKKNSCKVLYYISPQLWAWHQSRVKIIKKYVDEIAVVFPFEVDFYQKFNIKAHFIGHPLAKTVKPNFNAAEAKQILDINPTANPIIGLMPGSRRGEIKRLTPVMLQAAVLLKQKFPTAQFVLPLAPSLTPEDLQVYLQQNKLDLKIISGHTYDVINTCDALMVASGTATLEVGLLGKPFVLIYKVSALTYFIGKLVVKIPFLGICNIIAGKAVIKELIQQDATPKNIAAEISKIIDDQGYRQNMLQELADIKRNLSVEKSEDIRPVVMKLL